MISLIIGWMANDYWEVHKNKFVEPLESNLYDDFEYFLFNFSTDTTFQQEHVKLPIEHSTLILEKSELLKREYLNEWKFQELPMILPSQLYDNFQFRLTGNERLLQLYNTLYYFKFIKGKWYLIKVEQLI